MWVLRFGPYMLPFPPITTIFTFVVPVLAGALWIWRDANRRGQPGVIWALLTLPLGWFTVLAYLVVRTLQQPRPPTNAPDASEGTETP